MKTSVKWERKKQCWLYAHFEKWNTRYMG